MEKKRYYMGNFWWAKCSYINTLPDIKKLDWNVRYNAEYWIGMNKNWNPFNCFPVKQKFMHKYSKSQLKNRTKTCVKEDKNTILYFKPMNFENEICNKNYFFKTYYYLYNKNKRMSPL